jgi:hypothetical protein
MKRRYQIGNRTQQRVLTKEQQEFQKRDQKPDYQSAEDYYLYIIKSLLKGY